jgi:Ca-activated chloride channel family protein
MQADYVLDYDVVSVAREQHLYLLARVKAGPAPNAEKRRPLNLSVVLDRSGSMGGDKLEYVKKASQFLVQRLGSDDRFSLVVYDSTVEVKVNPGPVIHKDQINHTIRGLRAGSTTNLSGGWLQGCQLVEQEKADGQVNRVLLLTDGLANEGITDTPRLGKMARQKRAEGITTTTMGVGMGFNEDLLTKMAAEGGGAFYFIDDPDQAPKIFSEELQDLLSVVGQNLVIELTTATDVKLVRQLNTYPSDKQGDAFVYRMGDLFADEVKMLMVELDLPAYDDPGQVEVAHLKFDYDELGEDSATHRTLEIPIVITVSPDMLEDQTPDSEVAKTALLLRAARAREEAVEHADKGDFDQAKSVLSGIADEIDAADIDDEDLEAEHDMLREEAVDMDLGASRYDSYARKTHSTKSFMATQRTGAFMAQSTMVHMRQKQSRGAIERSQGTPTSFRWKRKTYDLAGIDRFTIGRKDDNDLVINEKEVSAHHCQIVRDGDDLYLEDLDSTNGTFANGGLLSDRFRLSTGDVVTVGKALLMFRD